MLATSCIPAGNWIVFGTPIISKNLQKSNVKKAIIPSSAEPTVSASVFIASVIFDNASFTKYAK